MQSDRKSIKDVRFFDETTEGVSVCENANEMSISHFAQCFVADVVISEPKESADNLKLHLENALEKYKN